MILAVTGHRPDKLGGYDFYNPVRVWIREQLRHKLIAHKPSYIISGMALGVDQDWAHVGLEQGIPFLAAIPFVGQESAWPAESKRYYKELLACANWLQVVSDGGYAAWKMQRRNEWMVDHCDLLIAVWDGSSGGTGNCVRYAKKVNRPYERIDPSSYQSSNRRT